MPIVPVNQTPDSEIKEQQYIIARARVRHPIIALGPDEFDDIAEVAAVPSAVTEIIKATPSDSGQVKERDAQSYRVGYGCPPKHTRFPKGQSGNPKGRPKEAKSFNTIVRETLTSKIRIRTAKGRKNTTNVQALMMQVLESALKGSQRDRHELLRYYREAIPDEPATVRSELAAASAEPDDIDTHDRAIIDQLRAKIMGELGDRS